MIRKLLIVFAVLTSIFGTASGTIGTGTILIAEKTDEKIVIDGKLDEDSWTKSEELIIRVQDGGIGLVDVSLKALYDQEYLYLSAIWADPTESTTKNLWTFNGSDWETSGDEDRIAFIWNIDDSISGFNIAGCAMLCHGDRMHTNAPDARGDLWHWKASRTNPAGYADDEWIDNSIVSGYSEEAKEAAMHGDGTLFPSEDTGYERNINSAENGPKYRQPHPGDEEDGNFLLLKGVEAGAVVEITGDTSFNVGDTVAGYILNRPSESRGDVDAGGIWHDGRWTLEL
ncbi:MAG: ethylbenzene dehydrogenase-related protein, partial [Candidatus Hydrothermarchaeales archaeon]